MLFQDRRDAGRQLAARVTHLYEEAPVVLAIPYGGVPVGLGVAQALGSTLGLWMTAKIPLPERPALGLGAVSEGGIVLTNRNVLWSTGISTLQFQRQCHEQYREVQRRIELLRDGHPPPAIAGKNVVLVDDGAATGATARAAARAIREENPRSLTLALPVASFDSLELLRTCVDAVVCLHPQSDLWPLGVWYKSFDPVSDREVRHLVALARNDAPPVEAEQRAQL